MLDKIVQQRPKDRYSNFKQKMYYGEKYFWFEKEVLVVAANYRRDCEVFMRHVVKR